MGPILSIAGGKRSLATDFREGRTGPMACNYPRCLYPEGGEALDTYFVLEMAVMEPVNKTLGLEIPEYPPNAKVHLLFL